MNKRVRTLIVLLVVLMVSMSSTTECNTSPQAIPHEQVIDIDILVEKYVSTKLIHTSDDGFVITANKNDSSFILKYNSIGKLMWTYGNKFGTSSSFNSIVELDNTDLVAIGTTVQSGIQKMIAVRLNENGNYINNLIVNNADKNITGIDILKTADNKLLLLGNAITNITWGLADVAFVKTNNVLTTEIPLKKINVLNYDKVNSVYMSKDNQILIAGGTKSGLMDGYSPLLLKLDLSGNLVWYKKLDNRVGYEASAVVQTTSNVIMLATAIKDNTDNTSNANVVVLDGNGVFINSYEYKSTNNDKGIDIVSCNNFGGVLLLASYGKPSATNYGVRDWILYLGGSDSLNIINETFYDTWITNHNPESIVSLSDDGSEYAYISNLNILGSLATKFVIKRVLKNKNINFVSMPINYQLYPRDVATNKATVTINGYINNSAEKTIYDKVQVKVYKNNVLISTQNANLNLTAQALFNFDININAELSNYTFKVFGLNGTTSTLEAEAYDVVSGDVYLVSGQSNSVGGEYAENDKSMFIRTFGKSNKNTDNYIWKPEHSSTSGIKYDDIRIGGIGLKFAKNIVDQYNVPVAIINGGIPGILIDSLMPYTTDHATDISVYGNHYRRMYNANVKDNIRAIVFFQGESNASGLNAGTTPEQYMEKFNTLDSNWLQDYPSAINRYIFQIRPGFPLAGGDRFSFLGVEEGQRRLAENNENIKIMSVTCAMKGTDRTHYTADGFRKLGTDLFRQVANDLYNGSYTDVNPPTITDAYFTNEFRNSITIEFDQATGNLNWVNDYNSDFILEGDAGTKVISASFDEPHKLVLNLNRMLASFFTGISYTSHDYGDSSSVYSSTHYVGMLCFKNYPVKSVFGNQFYQSIGWINGDQANSIPLSNGKVVWTFGDSWIDRYNHETQTVPCGVWLGFNTRNAIISHPMYEFNNVTTHRGQFNVNTYGNKGIFNIDNNDNLHEWPTDGFQLGNYLYIAVGSFSGLNIKGLHLAKFDINNLDSVIEYINTPFDSTAPFPYFGNTFVDDVDPNYIYTYGGGMTKNVLNSKFARIDILDVLNNIDTSNTNTNDMLPVIINLVEYNGLAPTGTISNIQQIITILNGSTLDSLTLPSPIETTNHLVYLARISKSNLTSWSFWNGTGWSSNFSQAKDLNKNFIITYGAYFINNISKVGNKYVMFMSEPSWGGGLIRGKKIFVSASDNLEGPFTNIEHIYTIPEIITTATDSYPAFFYSVFPHPEYTNADGLTPVTYCVNNGENCTDGHISPDYYKPKIFWYDFNNLNTTSNANKVAVNNIETQKTTKTNVPLSVYPNPTYNGLVNVKFNSSEDIMSVLSVYTLDGRLVSNKAIKINSGENIIPLQLPAEKGAYIIQYRNEQTNVISNIIVINQ